MRYWNIAFTNDVTRYVRGDWRNMRHSNAEMSSMMTKLFEAAVVAIKKEEDELNQLFSMNKDLYPNQHHGVCILYETTFVYLTFKELLKQQFPFTANWEYPYPSNKCEHSDLALINEVGELEALIEFKIWKEDHDRNIKQDICKLQRAPDCKNYIVVIGYGGDIVENDQFLLNSNISLNLIGKKGLTTKFYKTKQNLLADNELNAFLYEVKEEKNDGQQLD